MLRNFIRAHPTMHDNVIICRTAYKPHWGGSQIVFAQLSAYFELMDRSTFEYAVNLSAYDVPLMDVDVMYGWLRRHGPATNFMAYLATSKRLHREQSEWRVNRVPALQSRDHRPLFGEREHERIPDFVLNVYRGYAMTACHQWTVHTYSFLSHLRQDPAASMILAPIEFGFLVDEVYFSMWGHWSSLFYPTIDHRNTRCIEFSTHHPLPIDGTKLKMLWACVKQERLLTRKWYPHRNPDMEIHFQKMRDYQRRRLRRLL